MMGQVRKLTKEEMEESLTLSQFAFQYELTEEEKAYFIRTKRPEQTYGYFEGETLESKMTVLPLTVMLGNVAYKMGGIAGVATYPEQRRKGLVRNLLKIGLKELDEQGVTLSYLFPFTIPFYRKYGWELFCDEKKVVIASHELPKKGNAIGWMKRESLQQTDHLHSIYDTYCQSYFGMLKRTEKWWDELTYKRKKLHLSVYYREENRPTGYIMYEVKDRKMTISELVYTDEDSRGGLWNFISDHDSMIDQVELTLPASDESSFLFTNPKVKQELSPYFMARIVNVKLFLENYPFKAGTMSSLFVHVHDPFADWNNATYQVLFQGDKHEVKKFESKTDNLACQHPPKRGIQVNINMLTTMLMHYKRPLQLVKMGVMKGNEEEVKEWERRLGSNPPAFIDFF